MRKDGEEEEEDLRSFVEVAREDTKLPRARGDAGSCASGLALSLSLN